MRRGQWVKQSIQKVADNAEIESMVVEAEYILKRQRGRAKKPVALKREGNQYIKEYKYYNRNGTTGRRNGSHTGRERDSIYCSLRLQEQKQEGHRDVETDG